MTKQAQEEAYARGFCKVAEAYGVDPHELYKYAQAKKTVFKGIAEAGKGLIDKVRGNATAQKYLINPLKRYGQLMLGGDNKAIVEGLKASAGKGGFGTLRSGTNMVNALAGNPELQKVMLARLGTAGALAGASTIVAENKAYNRGREGREMNWWNY